MPPTNQTYIETDGEWEFVADWLIQHPVAPSYVRGATASLIVKHGLADLKDVSCGELFADAYQAWIEDLNDWR